VRVIPAGGAILGPAALAAVLAGAYLIASPPSTDLAAATFRAELFERQGFELWNNAWYSGHHLLSYSVLYPPLAALIGVRAVGALAAVAAAALFASLAEGHFGARALLPSLWFAAAVSSWLLTGRMAFLLGLPFGLAAVAAAGRDRHVSAAILAALAALASPVTGLFAALAGAAIALAGELRRGSWLVLGAAVPIVILNLLFPVGGEEPFVFDAFIAVPLLTVVALWLVPPQLRALRVGVVLYGLLAALVFAVANPLGGNVTRLGALFAGPVLALVLSRRGRALTLAVLIPLLYWQLIAPVRDLAKGAGDPATERVYFEPLLAHLDRVVPAGEPVRIHVPPTENRWEAAYVASRYPLARGWLRQLESEDFELFTGNNLTAGAYREWLSEQGVSYVALADAELDYLAEDEAGLIANGLGFLRPIWRGEHWQLFRVGGAAPIRVSRLGPSWFEIEAPGAGSYRPVIRSTPHWSVVSGSACVAEQDGWTVVEAEGAGPVRVEAKLLGDRCSG
jgi:hypothetical protein